jgi:hypothetical protein
MSTEDECEDEEGKDLGVEIIALGGRKPKMKLEEEAPKPKNRGQFKKKIK